MKNIIYLALMFLLSFSNAIAQTQTDIEWPTLADSDWPMIKHDPQFTGRSPYKGPQTPTIIWTADMKDGIFSGPVIGKEGNLYFGSYYQLDSADHFYSYTADGNLIWDYKLGTNRPPQSGILIDSSNTIYFGSLDGYFYALNPDGTLKWKYLTSNPIVELAIPNIDKEGRLYITNGQGELYSFNPDGTLNWNVSFEDGFFAKSPVFSPDGETIYISYKVDFYLYLENGKHLFIEFKTDSGSRRIKQDKYLLASQSVGMKTILEGIIKINSVTNYKTKYSHLIKKLLTAGLLLENNSSYQPNIFQDEIEILYIQPKSSNSTEIGFDEIAKLMNESDDIFYKKFSEILFSLSND